MTVIETGEDLEFKWGKKKGMGGRNKDCQFYESFTYDGLEYRLYDCVYLYMEGEPEPEIGKLIKIWETGDKVKKVKVLWFFRPCEILNFLRAEEILEKELFLASGEGAGLANLNPLEAIAGKCNVLCISKDKENPQPSDEDLKMAEFVFRRTFDVGLRKIMDRIDGKIAGIDVKFIYNRMDIQKPEGILKVDLGIIEVCGNAIGSNETMVLSKKNSSREISTLDTNGNCVDSSTQGNADLVKLKLESVENLVSGVGLKSSGMDKCNEKREHMSNPKALLRSKIKSDEDNARRGKDVDMDNRPTKKAKLDGTIKVSSHKADSTTKASHREDSIIKASHQDNTSDGKIHVEVEENLRCVEGYIELDHGQGKKAKHDTSSKVVNEKSKSSDQKGYNDDLLSSASVVDDEYKRKNAEDSHGTNKDPFKKKKLDGKVALLSDGELPKTAKRRLKHAKDSLRKAEDSPRTTKDSPRTDEDPSKKTKLEDKVLMRSDDKLPKASQRKLKRAEDSVGANENPSKKAKPIDKILVLSDGKAPQSKLKDAENSRGTVEAPLKELKPNDKAGMLSNAKFPNEPLTKSPKGEKFGGQELEVARHPDVDRRTWFKGFPWEDRMQTAHQQGTLVLLQNLDPAYTSAEVEDIVWRGFKESCSAKMIQQTANSSPHSGKALVIFRSREAAEMAVRKLDECCLLLSNGRPLVGSIDTPFPTDKKPTFFGHLVIDKLRHLRDREMKEAVSTSHCSQPNTIEYDMAMEWCLRLERSDILWNSLYKQHGKELRKLKAELKAK